MIILVTVYGFDQQMFVVYIVIVLSAYKES